MWWVKHCSELQASMVPCATNSTKRPMQEVPVRVPASWSHGASMLFHALQILGFLEFLSFLSRFASASASGFKSSIFKSIFDFDLTSMCSGPVVQWSTFSGPFNVSAAETRRQIRAMAGELGTQTTSTSRVYLGSILITSNLIDMIVEI